MFLNKIEKPSSPIEILQHLKGEAGENLRAKVETNNSFFKLKDLRYEAREKERKIDNNPDLTIQVPEEWKEIKELSLEILLNKSRDIEITGWLVEACTRLDFLSGFSFSVSLMVKIFQDFWDTAYPELDLEDPDGRFFPISGLSGEGRDGTLIQPLRKLPLFEIDGGDTLTFWQFMRSQEVSLVSAQGGHLKVPDNILNFQEIEKKAYESRAEFKNLAEQCRVARKVWKDLEETIDQKCSIFGVSQPSMRRVKTLLEEIQLVCDRYAPASGFFSKEKKKDMKKIVATPQVSRQTPPRVLELSNLSRDEILNKILRLADEFRRREPQSPLGYAIENSVQQARLGLPDLLKNVIEDEAMRLDVMTKLGMTFLKK